MPKVIHNGIIFNISNLEIIHVYQYGMTEYNKTYPHNETACIPKTMSKVSMHYCGMTSRIYCFMKRPRGKVLCIVCHFLKSVCQCTCISVDRDYTGVIHIGHL